MLTKVIGYCDVTLLAKDMINQSIDPISTTEESNTDTSELSGIYMGKVVSKNELERCYEEFGHLFHSSYKDMVHNGIVFYDLINITSRVVVNQPLLPDKIEQCNKIIINLLHPLVMEEDPILVEKTKEDNEIIRKHWPLAVIISMIFYSIGVLSQKYFS